MAEVIESQAEDENRHAELPTVVWSGSLRMGLVDIPVRAVPITMDRKVRFRMLHRSCGTPISNRRYCELGEEVPFEDIAYGYKIQKGRYVAFSRNEIEEARPESSKIIDLDSFVNFFEADPHYFERSYLLIPDKSESSYALLRDVLEQTGKAAIGRMTMRSKERIVLIHYYRHALVATTLRYADEVLDPGQAPELSHLPEPNEKELRLAREIVDRLTGTMDLTRYQDSYRQRIEAMVQAQLDKKPLSFEKKARGPTPRRLEQALEETASALR